MCVWACACVCERGLGRGRGAVVEDWMTMHDGNLHCKNAYTAFSPHIYLKKLPLCIVILTGTLQSSGSGQRFSTVLKMESMSLIAVKVCTWHIRAYYSCTSFVTVFQSCYESKILPNGWEWIFIRYSSHPGVAVLRYGLQPVTLRSKMHF